MKLTGTILFIKLNGVTVFLKLNGTTLFLKLNGTTLFLKLNTIFENSTLIIFETKHEYYPISKIEHGNYSILKTKHIFMHTYGAFFIVNTNINLLFLPIFWVLIEFHLIYMHRYMYMYWGLVHINLLICSLIIIWCRELLL